MSRVVITLEERDLLDLQEILIDGDQHVPLAFELGLGFAIFSYDERLFIGLIADGAAIDDLDPLARHVAQAFEDLRTAAGVPAIPPVPTGRPDSSRGTRADADR